jgi:transmembrane sensor
VNIELASDCVRQAAAVWHDRLRHENVSEETRQMFDRWLAQSPEHQRAYSAIDETWSALRAGLQEAEFLALRHETALRLSRRTLTSMGPLRLATAAAIVLTFGCLATLMLGPAGAERSILARVLEPFNTQTDRTYTTAVGERLGVTLPDGSQVTLDTQSQVRVTLTKLERRVHLVRGQASFEVTKDRTRPFVVEARNQRLVAVGTSFDVRVDEREVKVTMIEGAVRVEPATGEVGRLIAGEQLVVDAHNESHVRRADLQSATSWHRGQIVFDDTRLGDAIEELNRYSQTRIALADSTLADLRLSGAFPTSRPEVFVEAVTAYFPVVIASDDAQSIILKAR